VDALEAFYVSHVEDERSVLFEKQRLRLRKLLAEYEGIGPGELLRAERQGERVGGLGLVGCRQRELEDAAVACELVARARCTVCVCAWRAAFEGRMVRNR
jgi:hypothetical protein